MSGKFVSYLRCSTRSQQESGLGIEAQRAAVANHIGDAVLVAEFVEAESGRNNDRPQLAKALELCRMTGSTLIVAKIDRLARNARFLLSIVEGTGMGGVVFCDLPSIPLGPVGKFLLTQMSAVAELEAGLCSARTKASLAACRARGVKLGGWRGGPKVDPGVGLAARLRAADAFARSVGPVAAELHRQGVSLRQIAVRMAERGIQTAKGGEWTATAVKALLARYAALTAA